MKKSSLCRIAAAGTALFLSAITIFPSFAAGQGIGPGFEEEVEDTSGRPASPLDMKKPAAASATASAKNTETVTDAGTGTEADAEAGTDGTSVQKAAVSDKTAVPGESYGIFRISGYCGCEICSGGNHLTYSGTVPTAGHTLSADLERFPLGTKLLIDGTVYTVEDMGGGVTGDRLDIYFDTHQEALDYGLKDVEVFAVLEEN